MPTPPSMPRCHDAHTLEDTISRSTLLLSRSWGQEDVDDVLGDPELPSAHVEFPREVIPGGGDRFCMGRVILAEIADDRLNPHLGPSHREARRQIDAGAAIVVRSGMGRWYTLAPAREARVGREVYAPGTDHAHEIEHVGMKWQGVVLIDLADH